MTQRDALTFEVIVHYPDDHTRTDRFDVAAALVRSSPDAARELVIAKLTTITDITFENV